MVKKYFKVAFSCLAAMSMTVFVGCSSEDNPITVGLGEHPEREIIDVHGKSYDVTGAITTGAVNTVGMAYGNISGQVDQTVMSAVYERYVVGVQVAKDEKFTTGCKEFEASPAEDGSFTVDCSGLAANQQYYYRAFTKIVDKYVFGSASTFTTNDLTQNIVSANAFDNSDPLLKHQCNADLTKIALDQVGKGSCYVGVAYYRGNASTSKSNLTEANITSWIKNQWTVLKDSSLTQIPQAEDMLIEMKPIEEVAANGDFTIYTYRMHPGTNTTKYYWIPFTCIVSEDNSGNLDVRVKTEDRNTYVVDAHSTASYYGFATSGLVDLGLSSGVKWNSRNFGSSNIYSKGTTRYWGQIGTNPPYSPTVLFSGTDISGFVYKQYDEQDPTKLVLAFGDDATDKDATLRMPTSAEMQELIDDCIWIRANYRGGTSYSGYVIVGKNRKCIFLPMTVGGNVIEYWTSTGVDNGSCMESYALLTVYNSTTSASRTITGVSRSGNALWIRPVDMASKQ